MATAGGHLSMDLDGDFDDGNDTPMESSSLEDDETTPDGLSNSSDAAGVAMHGSGSEDDDTPVESFPVDEHEAADTTAAQFYREGRDLQGIPWERLQVCEHCDTDRNTPCLLLCSSCCMLQHDLYKACGLSWTVAYICSSSSIASKLHPCRSLEHIQAAHLCSSAYTHTHTHAAHSYAAHAHTCSRHTHAADTIM